MNRFFSVLVAGNNPEEIIQKYGSTIEVEPYIKYKLEDVDKIYENRVKIYETILSTNDKSFNFDILEQANLCLKRIKQLSPFEYYQQISKEFIIDKETGNLLTTQNPNLKYEIIKPETLLMIGEENTHQALKREINFEKLHRNQERLDLQIRTYQLCINKLIPSSETDKLILENMRKFPDYFNTFKNENEYVLYCESLAFYAFVTEDEWIEMPLSENYIDWKINFYDKFIKNLPNNILLTTYIYKK